MNPMPEQTTPIHINEIQLSGEDKFTKRFNQNGRLWQAAHDETKTEEERKEAFQAWFQDRQMLEMGM